MRIRIIGRWCCCSCWKSLSLFQLLVVIMIMTATFTVIPQHHSSHPMMVDGLSFHSTRNTYNDKNHNTKRIRPRIGGGRSLFCPTTTVTTSPLFSATSSSSSSSSSHHDENTKRKRTKTITPSSHHGEQQQQQHRQQQSSTTTTTVASTTAPDTKQSARQFMKSHLLKNSKNNSNNNNKNGTTSNDNNGTSLSYYSPNRHRKKRSRNTFHRMFSELENFYEEHGHCHVTAADNGELYKWTCSIRKNYKHQYTTNFVEDENERGGEGGKNGGSGDDAASTSGSSNNERRAFKVLSAKKFQQLQSINFVWNVQDYIWERHYQKLVEFYKQHNLLNTNTTTNTTTPTSIADFRRDVLPLLYIDEEEYYNTELVVWVRNQQREYRYHLQELPTTLTKERLRKLLDLGVLKNYRLRQQVWKRYYSYLVEYQRENGHVNVPQRYDHPVTIRVQDGVDPDIIHERNTTFALGKWCMNQRIAKKRWDDKQQRMEKKRRRKKKNSRSNNVHQPNDTSSLSMGDIATKERIELLEELDFSWNQRETDWYAMLQRLRAYYRQHGHLEISTDDTENDDLRRWLIYQRYFYHQLQKQQKQKQQPSSETSSSSSSSSSEVLSTVSSPMTSQRIEAIEETIPNFSWTFYNKTGPSVEDWSNLFSAMRSKGIQPGMKPKRHWFEGANPFATEVKSVWTEQELIDLWYQDDDDGNDLDDDMDDDFDGIENDSPGQQQQQQQPHYYVNANQQNDNKIK